MHGFLYAWRKTVGAELIYYVIKNLLKDNHRLHFDLLFIF